MKPAEKFDRKKRFELLFGYNATGVFFFEKLQRNTIAQRPLNRSRVSANPVIASALPENISRRYRAGPGLRGSRDLNLVKNIVHAASSSEINRGYGRPVDLRTARNIDVRGTPTGRTAGQKVPESLKRAAEYVSATTGGKCVNGA